MTTAAIDARYSEADAVATPWADAVRALAACELYTLTTVRADGRPHVCPLVGVWDDVDGAFVFCTGAGEQKAANLRGSTLVAVSASDGRWAAGLDVVLEGRAERVGRRDDLTRHAATYLAKYGPAWEFPVTDDGFGPPEHPADVYRVRPVVAFAFAKDPHGQTRYTPD